MTGANNMYIQGKKIQREWMNSLYKLKSKFGGLFFPNKNKSIPSGTIIELPAQNRDFQPDWEKKELKPVDFSHLRNASLDEISKAVKWVEENIGWYHSIDLKNGITTPGARGWEARKRIFKIPERVKGKTVLDIGSMEGGDSFCAEESGAKAVTAYDVDNYFEYDLGLNSAWEYVIAKYKEAKAQGPEKEWIFFNNKRFGFELCKQVRKSTVNRISGSVYNLDPAKYGTFDIVYFFGLIYHLRHPILALEKIFSVTKEMTFINSPIFSGYTPEPNTILFFNDTWQGSYTNWFVPTAKSLIELVSNVGYKKIEVVNCTASYITIMCYK